MEACSLNVGSTNLGRSVYCNPIDDVEYCIREMLKQKKTPEVETFEIGHTWAMEQLMKKYEFADPVLFSIVLGLSLIHISLPDCAGWPPLMLPCRFQ